VAASNGSIINEGQLISPRLPNNWLARIQVVEYMRSFTQSRTALGKLNMLLILSGVFAIFRRDLIMAIGGFLTKHQQTRAGQEYCGVGAHTVCEDMEVVIRLHRYLLDRGRSGRMILLPEPLAWTEVPEDMTSLGKQRSRWQRGLYECLLLHKDMFFKKRFGVVGWFAMPYQLLYEALTPMIELLGIVLVPLAAAFGLLSWKVCILLLLTAFLANVVVSCGSVVVAMWAEFSRSEARGAEKLFHYDGQHVMAKLLIAAVAENVVYRQVLLYWRLKGTWDFLRGRQGWDKFARKGFAATAAK
jgi:cellulose synthase/poly-beta-1,6-N-acetylglucosamine synthase-like glycosyltransferase